MEIKCGAESEKEISFRCVQCGFSVTTLYIQYSPGNIRLMKCGNCKAVADEYIECELMILVIDLILHKIKAYRHLFYNRFSRETLHNEVLLWKLALGFLILDAYQMLVVCTTQDERSLPTSFASFLGLCGKVLMGVFFGNLMFLGIILFGTRRFLNAKVGDSRCKHILLSILVSSYFKIFVIAMMVWEFPSSVVFIITMFVLSSNALALLESTGNDLFVYLTLSGPQLWDYTRSRRISKASSLVVIRQEFINPYSFNGCIFRIDLRVTSNTKRFRLKTHPAMLLNRLIRIWYCENTSFLLSLTFPTRPLFNVLE